MDPWNVDHYLEGIVPEEITPDMEKHAAIIKRIDDFKMAALNRQTAIDATDLEFKRLRKEARELKKRILGYFETRAYALFDQEKPEKEKTRRIKKTDDERSFNKIMQDIKSGLKGDPEVDIYYLLGVGERYKNHELFVEITREVGSMISRLIPEDKKKDFKKIYDRFRSDTDRAMEKAAELIRKGDLDEAEKVIREALPPEEMYREDERSVFMVFRQPIEEAYFRARFKVEKEIRLAAGVNPEIFLALAYILIEKSELDEAMDMLDRGLRFNPMHTNLLFEKAEIFKLRKDWKGFKEIVDLCLEYSYSASDVARAYRDYGYMLIEREEFDAAICCYLISMNFEPTETAQSQLFYIFQLLENEPNFEDAFEHLQELLESVDVPPHPNPEMAMTAAALSDHFEQEGDLEQALFCLDVIFQLTGSDEVEEKLKTMKARMEDS